MPFWQTSYHFKQKKMKFFHSNPEKKQKNYKFFKNNFNSCKCFCGHVECSLEKLFKIFLKSLKTVCWKFKNRIKIKNFSVKKIPQIFFWTRQCSFDIRAGTIVKSLNILCSMSETVWKVTFVQNIGFSSKFSYKDTWNAFFAALCTRIFHQNFQNH